MNATIRETIVQVGTKTYNRIPYAVEVLESASTDSLRTHREFYHCLHMAMEVKERHPETWLLLGTRETAPFRVTPCIVAVEGDEYRVFKPSNGIFSGLRPGESEGGWSILTSSDGFRIRRKDGDTYNFTWDINAPSEVQISDLRFVRRRNFPSDKYQMAYRRGKDGSLLAVVCLFYQDKNNTEEGSLVVKIGKILTYKVTSGDFRPSSTDFIHAIEQASEVLDLSSHELIDDVCVLFPRLSDLKTLQVQ